MQDLIVVDQEILFRKEKLKCEEAQFEAERLRTELERFRDRDRPAFTQWVQTSFGKKLVQIRNAILQTAEKLELIREVERELRVARRNRLSPQQAYRRVLERRNSEQEELFVNADDQDEDEPSEDEESFSREQRPPFETQTKRTIPEETKTEIKGAYRELVRKLHPDTNPDLSKRHKELWHQVQAAYEADDLSRLETLVALVAAEDPGASAQTTSLSDFRRAFAELQKTIRQLKAERGHARRDPAWNFCEVVQDKKSMSQLSKKIASDLTFEDFKVQDELAQLESILEEWESGPEPESYSRQPESRRLRGRSRRHQSGFNQNEFFGTE